MLNLKNICIKYQSFLLYVIFGILTTIVNIIVFFILYNMLHTGHNIAYVVAWFWAVLFAYLTNRVWVFHSTSSTTADIVKEVWQFYLARVLTGIIGYFILTFGVDLLHQDANIWNIIQNIFVIVSNFVLSKLIIFKKDNDT
ncbi:GtrA family protein [Leuconostoc gelidum]|uniref:GtrA family protein n=1 Tax=Leuconostoc gelidum subsp. gelidum TaxID=1607839 RepID=A0AB35G1T2_LEUGE|nr:GtrA family protein [Leuconostoc gelidum]AFS39838.1 teichoic acid glycosylation protein [Leuconostoc gelidum JB7]MBZ5964640.1 GtrA family protein [Leuconostoc gelidum subsp. gelidum]MBZ5974755.1 GtrA family protein [Leuconostoc gelidum subsp. gelidum]MBZ5977595.1 GtrA family protein [Leuconostoc gelidum subsp. gelidum]MBZ5986467.1 GtrA family protein [Leuconostoc gelidum subsp. gelidum]